MIEVVVPALIVLALVLGIEALRWTLRPEARRVRLIRKIGRKHEL